MKFKRALIAASFAAASLMAQPALAAKTIGSADGGGCFPFVCNLGATSFDVFQIYSAEAFGPSAITFDTITFFDALAPEYPASFLGDVYDISFAVTTEAGLGSTSLPASLVFTSFFSGSLAGSGLSITGNAFTYNPAGGNLVMRVVVLDATPTAADPEQGSLLADYTGLDASVGGSVVFLGDDNPTDLEFTDGALVTQFSNSGAVPEPGTWALMILGFGAAGALLRARRRYAAIAA